MPVTVGFIDTVKKDVRLENLSKFGRTTVRICRL